MTTYQQDRKSHLEEQSTLYDYFRVRSHPASMVIQSQVDLRRSKSFRGLWLVHSLECLRRSSCIRRPCLHWMNHPSSPSNVPTSYGMDVSKKCHPMQTSSSGGQGPNQRLSHLFLQCIISLLHFPIQQTELALLMREPIREDSVEGV